MNKVSMNILVELTKRELRKQDLAPVLNLTSQTIYARFNESTWTVGELEIIAAFLGVEAGDLL